MSIIDFFGKSDIDEIFVFVNAMKYSISTKTLYFIRACSEKYFEKLLVLEWYLPSMGVIAFRELSCMFFLLKVYKANLF